MFSRWDIGPHDSTGVSPQRVCKSSFYLKISAHCIDEEQLWLHRNLIFFLLSIFACPLKIFRKFLPFLSPRQYTTCSFLDLQYVEPTPYLISNQKEIAFLFFFFSVTEAVTYFCHLLPYTCGCSWPVLKTGCSSVAKIIKGPDPRSRL